MLEVTINIGKIRDASRAIALSNGLPVITNATRWNIDDCAFINNFTYNYNSNKSKKINANKNQTKMNTCKKFIRVI